MPTDIFDQVAAPSKSGGDIFDQVGTKEAQSITTAPRDNPQADADLPSAPPAPSLTRPQASAEIDRATTVPGREQNFGKGGTLDLGAPPPSPRSVASGLVSEQAERRAGAPLEITPKGVVPKGENLPVGEPQLPVIDVTPDPLSPNFKGELPGSFEGHPENTAGFVETGPIAAARGAGKIMANTGAIDQSIPDNPEEVLKGGTELMSGAATTLAPTVPFSAAAAPATVLGSIAAGYGASKGVRYGLDQTELPDSVKDFGETAAWFLPSLFGHITGARGEAIPTPEGKTGFGASAFGDRVAAGVVPTPEGVQVAGKFGSKVGKFTVPGTRPPVEPSGLEAPTIEAPVPMSGEAPAPSSMVEQAVEAKAKYDVQNPDILDTVAPPGTVNRVPAQPPAPPAPKYPEVNDANLSAVAEVVKSLPKEQQSDAIIEAHEHVAKALLEQGKAFVNGKLEVIDNEKQASKVAQSLINEHIKQADADVTKSGKDLLQDSERESDTKSASAPQTVEPSTPVKWDAESPTTPPDVFDAASTGSQAPEKPTQVASEPTQKFKHGNTQADIPHDSEAGKSLEAARARVSDSDLMGDGKDIGENHVTVRYGIKGSDTSGIKKFLESQSPFEAKLGKTDKFPASEHSDGAVPIIAPVEAQELHRINAELEKHGDFIEPTFKEYRPHATVAYVKPDKAGRYVGMDVTHGKKFKIESVTISKRDGSTEVVKLKGPTSRAGVWTPAAPATSAKAQTIEIGSQLAYEGKLLRVSSVPRLGPVILKDESGKSYRLDRKLVAETLQKDTEAQKQQAERLQSFLNERHPEIGKTVQNLSPEARSILAQSPELASHKEIHGRPQGTASEVSRTPSAGPAETSGSVSPVGGEGRSAGGALDERSARDGVRESAGGRDGAVERVITAKEDRKLESRKQIPGVDGHNTELLTPNGRTPAKYRVVEAASLVPSHDPVTFGKNSGYPEGVQERAYHTSKEAQARVIQQAQNYEPAYTVNTNPDAVNGPPVITPDGTVLGGNSRAMSTIRLYRTGNPGLYREALSKNAEQFGLSGFDLAKMKQPVLVREIPSPPTIEETRRLAADLNKPMTGALGVSERAVSAGKSIKPATLQIVSSMLGDLGDSASLRDLMRERGGDLVKMLSADGVITDRERPQFVDTATGGLSEEGKTFVERALLGSVIDDPTLMDRIPKNILNKIEGSLGDISSIAGREDEYNILPLLREALNDHAEIAKQGSTVDLHLAQAGMFGPQRNHAVDALVRALTKKPTEVRLALRGFAQDANFDVQNQSTLGFGEQPSPVSAFNAAFRTDLSEREFADALLQSLQNAATITKGVRSGTPGQEESNLASAQGVHADTSREAPRSAATRDEKDRVGNQTSVTSPSDSRVGTRSEAPTSPEVKPEKYVRKLKPKSVEIPSATAPRLVAGKFLNTTEGQRIVHQPGQVVPSYGGGWDKVLEYLPTGGIGGTWAVKVIASDADGNPLPKESPRIHATHLEGREWRVYKQNADRLAVGIQNKIVPGARSASTGSETGTSAMQDLTDSIARQVPKGASLKERLRLGARIGRQTEDAQNSVSRMMGRLSGGMAALWEAYKAPPKWGNFENAVGKWSGAENASALDLYRFTKAIKKAVPDKARREAISNWIEAAGDEKLLKERAEKSAANPETAKFAKGYELATQLTDEEKTIANNIVNRNDATLEEAQAAGILDAGVENYVRHIYKDKPGMVERVMAEMAFKSLQTKPSFTKKRKLPTYFDAEQLGFEPKDKDIGFLTASHERAFREALAARAFIKALQEGKANDGRPLVATSWASAKEITPEDAKQSAAYMIKPNLRPGEAFADYKAIDHPALRGWKWAGETEDGKPFFVQGDMLVHPEIYRKLTNNLSKSAIRHYSVEIAGKTIKPGEALLKITGEVKHGILSFSGFHQTTLAVHGMEHRVVPAMIPELDLNDPIQRGLVDHGLMVASYDAMSAFGEGIASGGMVTKIPAIGPTYQAYTDYLFHSYMPRLKMAMAKDAFERNTERYKDELSNDQIYALTAAQANAAFGGVNLKLLARNPTFQDFLRLTLMAPDFLEARARFAGQAAKPYGREQLIALALGGLILYTIARILNMLTDHKPNWDRPFGVVSGSKEYQMRSVQEDMYRAATDTGKFAMNRLSPTVSTAIQLGQGRNRFGRKQTFSQAAIDAAKNNVPIPAQPWVRKSDDTNAQKAAETFWKMVGVNVRGASKEKK